MPRPESAIPALALAAFLVLLGLALAPGYTCSDVGHTGPPPGGFEFLGLQHGDLAWTPDGGVNTCQTGIAILLVPAGIALGLIGTWRLVDD